MKSVMLSIKPKFCELIANGKKTVEVRKTRPKAETPFRCFVYCTKQGRPLVYGSPFPGYVDENLVQTYGYSKEKAEELFGCWSGKVIGEFICDDIIPLHDTGEAIVAITDYDITACCLDYYELHAYANGKPIYGWHISDLVIYDKAKTLEDFARACIGGNDCPNCRLFDFAELECTRERLKRPPQSWCYVEELGGERHDQL